MTAAHSRLRTLVYGASGFTGGLIVDEAMRLTPAQDPSNRPLSLTLAGRSTKRLKDLANRHNLPVAPIDIDAPDKLRTQLAAFDVLVNAAGPFSTTAMPLACAAIATGTHYLDVTGELPVFESLYTLDDAARRAGTLVLPGVGFAIVPSDCAAVALCERMPDARHLRIGLSRGMGVSRGSAETMVEMIRPSVRTRRAGRAAQVSVGQRQHPFDFGRGQVPCAAVNWPDVFTAGLSTKVPNVSVYAELSSFEEGCYIAGGRLASVLRTRVAQTLLKQPINVLPRQPRRLAKQSRIVVVEAEDRWRQTLRASVSTADGYTFTGHAVVSALRALGNSPTLAGFQTPAMAFGPNFLATCGNAELTIAK